MLVSVDVGRCAEAKGAKAVELCEPFTCDGGAGESSGEERARDGVHRWGHSSVVIEQTRWPRFWRRCLDAGEREMQPDAAVEVRVKLSHRVMRGIARRQQRKRKHLSERCSVAQTTWLMDSSIDRRVKSQVVAVENDSVQSSRSRLSRQPSARGKHRHLGENLGDDAR